MSLSRELNVLMVASDPDILREGSGANVRIRECAAITERLHIIFLSSQKENIGQVQIAPNCILYSTDTSGLWSGVSKARDLANQLFLPASGKGVDPEAWQSVLPISLVVAENPYLSGLAGFLIARKLRRPFHMEIRDDIFAPAFRKLSFANVLRYQCARFLLHRRPDVRVVSERIKAAIFSKTKFFFRHYPHVVILPDFVDAERLLNTAPTFDLHANHPGFNLIALVVARLEKEKNVREAIRVLRAAHEEKPNIAAALVIAGSGSEEISLRKYAERLGVGDRVFFYGWQDDLLSFYKTADVLLVTSLYEGYGKTLIEAAASGCPILTNDVGVAREFLPFSNATICAPEDDGCFRRNVANLADNPDLRRALKTAAQGGSRRIPFRTKEEYYTELSRLWETAVAEDQIDGV